jgi:Zn-dependent protease with chaperone function
MQIKGYWYPANSAARYPATLNIQADQFSLVISDQDNLVGKVNTLSVSDRIGNITRKIGLYDQSIFETQANDQIDQLLSELNHQDKKLQFLHHLETHWHWIATALLLTVVISFFTIYWGLPWASEKLAYSMPKVVSEKVSEGTLDILDKVLLEPSELDKQQQASIRQHFEETLLSMHSKENANLSLTQSANYQLKFRKLDDIPNALALPSGTIIITDALINMTDNQAEIDSVLLHEIGHIESRHGLQQIIHSSIVTIGLAMMIGDATAVEEMLIALPTLLLQSHYSRKHETEADDYAFEQMVKLNIDPIHFAHLFEKMLAWEKYDTATPSRPNEQDKANLLSTHPSSPERIQRAREYSKQYF